MNIKLKAVLRTVAIIGAIPAGLFGGIALLRYLLPNPEHAALFLMGVGLSILTKLVYDINLDILRGKE
jgi:hypothetical protein